MRKENISCNLISNNNYFTTAKKIEPKHYWRGYYKCKNCKSSYVAIIKEINVKKDVIIDITIENDCKKCKEETIRIRSTGAARKDLAKNLMIKGTLNVKSDHIIFNEKNQENIQSKMPCIELFRFSDWHLFLDFKTLPKITNQDVLNVIKSELKNVDRLSSNIIDDTRTAKFIFDSTLKTNNEIKGTNYMGVNL